MKAAACMCGTILQASHSVLGETVESSQHIAEAVDLLEDFRI